MYAARDGKFAIRNFLVQRIEPLSRVHQRRDHLVPNASVPPRVRVQCVRTGGCCAGNSMQRGKDTVVGRYIETLAWYHKRRPVPDRCRSAEFP